MSVYSDNGNAPVFERNCGLGDLRGFFVGGRVDNRKSEHRVRRHKSFAGVHFEARNFERFCVRLEKFEQLGWEEQGFFAVQIHKIGAEISFADCRDFYVRIENVLELLGGYPRFRPLSLSDCGVETLV